MTQIERGWTENGRRARIRDSDGLIWVSGRTLRFGQKKVRSQESTFLPNSEVSHLENPMSEFQSKTRDQEPLARALSW